MHRRPPGRRCFLRSAPPARGAGTPLGCRHAPSFEAIASTPTGGGLQAPTGVVMSRGKHEGAGESERDREHRVARLEPSAGMPARAGCAGATLAAWVQPTSATTGPIIVSGTSAAGCI
jgi:hypothetical protein